MTVGLTLPAGDEAADRPVVGELRLSTDVYPGEIYLTVGLTVGFTVGKADRDCTLWVLQVWPNHPATIEALHSVYLYSYTELIA